MKIDTVTLRLLADAADALEEARNSASSVIAADRIDDALEEVANAMRNSASGVCVVKPRDADELCAHCGGLMAGIAACAADGCPHRQGYTDAG